MCLTTLFNMISKKGIPIDWNTITVTSLHKKGPVNDPSNYRGLAVMQCLPKLYSTILYNHLVVDADNSDLRAPT